MFLTPSPPQDGANKLQVIASFDHCLTAFHAKDGKTPCLKTTDALEQVRSTGSKGSELLFFLERVARWLMVLVGCCDGDSGAGGRMLLYAVFVVAVWMYAARSKEDGTGQVRVATEEKRRLDDVMYDVTSTYSAHDWSQSPSGVGVCVPTRNVPIMAHGATNAFLFFGDPTDSMFALPAVSPCVSMGYQSPANNPVLFFSCVSRACFLN